MSKLGTMEDYKNELLMNPGPTEFDLSIYKTLSQKTLSHFDNRFAPQFGNALKMFRLCLLGDMSTQPYIISGGGSIGWDCIISSLCYPNNNDKALILNTGYFGENFKLCCDRYRIKNDQLFADIGDTINYNQLINILTKNKDNPYKIVCITHVDTSTGVCNDIQTLSKIIKTISPTTLIAVDGVASFAAEKFNFSKWNIDAALTGSQKAFGVPPGLCMMLLSKNAVNILKKNESKIYSYYSNLYNWLPVMQAYENNQCKYFSTPNVNLIQALETSLKLIMSEGLENVYARHYKVAYAFKKAIKSLGLEFITKKDSLQPNSLSVIKFPKNVDNKKFFEYCKEKGCLFSGVLHRKLPGNAYFRVGHMGVSTKYKERKDLYKSIVAIEYALKKCGFQFKEGIGVKTYLKSLETYSIHSKL